MGLDESLDWRCEVKLLGPFDRPSMALFRENPAEGFNITAGIHVYGEPHFRVPPFRG